MTKETFIVIVKMAYKDCPAKARPVGLFAPEDVIDLIISDRSTRRNIEDGVKKITLSAGKGNNVRVGYEPAMLKYMEEIRPVINEKYGANFELELKAVKGQ